MAGQVFRQYQGGCRGGEGVGWKPFSQRGGCSHFTVLRWIKRIRSIAFLVFKGLVRGTPIGYEGWFSGISCAVLVAGHDV